MSRSKKPNHESVIRVVIVISCIYSCPNPTVSSTAIRSFDASAS